MKGPESGQSIRVIVHEDDRAVPVFDPTWIWDTAIVSPVLGAVGIYATLALGELTSVGKSGSAVIGAVFLGLGTVLLIARPIRAYLARRSLPPMESSAPENGEHRHVGGVITVVGHKIELAELSGCHTPVADKVCFLYWPSRAIVLFLVAPVIVWVWCDWTGSELSAVALTGWMAVCAAIPVVVGVLFVQRICVTNREAYIEHVGLVGRYLRAGRRISLSGARVHCDFSHGTLSVESRNGARMDVGLRYVGRPHRLAAAVIAGVRGP